MRTIKCRGKRIDNDDWVFGYYVLDPKANVRIYWSPFEDATSNTYHFVDPETVGQFTGRTDLKGVDVFEGDRVSDPHGNPGECELFTVEYNDEMARFDLNGEGEAEWDETDWQVYDNIHEQKPTIQLSEQ